ncbi:MgPa adhesin [Mycoplasmoides genitalium M2288]|nr:MgPa adhesin [Mycoplasmoides genitalium M2288]
MLLVPKVVVEYHKLSKKVVKESLEVEATDSFDPTQRLQKDSPMKDSTKTGEKLQETMSSMSGMATSTRKALKVEVERGSKVNQGELAKNDFAKKPLKHKENSGEVKLDAEKDFTEGKVWKPVLTTDEIEKNRGMGAT